jgi:protein O-GlcNAc transferase
MSQFSIDQAFQIALQHHQAGRIQQAENLYRRILTQQPTHADALHNLGVIAHHAKRNDMAESLLRQVLALQPNNAHAYCNLGNALKDNRQLDDAIAAFRVPSLSIRNSQRPTAIWAMHYAMQVS